MDPLVAPDGTIVVVGDRNVVHGFSPLSGREIWRQDMASYVHCQPSISEDGLMAVGVNNGRDYAYRIPCRGPVDVPTGAAPTAEAPAPSIETGATTVRVGDVELPVRQG